MISFVRKTMLVIAGAMLASTGWAAEEKVLNIYNWSDYIAEDTITNFEKKTGIKVNYDVFDSNEVLEAKLLAGSSGYDVVVPSASFMERQIKAGVFRALDKGKLSNWSKLDKGILSSVALHDPGNAHGAPYMWGTTGFAFNTKMIKKRMPNAPTDSWDMIFKPEVVSKFADCGVTLLDAPTEVASSAMNYLGLDPNSEKKEDLKAAEKLLKSIRPYIRYFHSSQNINDLANGEICIAMGWSGDMFIARDRAAEAKKGVEIEYVIPKEGAVIWFDMMAIPADAPHPENAQKWINYILEPKVAAAISDYVWYANPNSAATKFVSDDVKNDPAIYPPAKVQQKLFPDKARSAKFTRKLTRTWTRIKSGK
ncbi:MAG: polyamine ABC transporter substrate-binding protein [Gammaproteobacteria bacterium]|jgi:putrescine transport system substrate-binding protein|nr:polyamine ABC transporter substrate-binding protein [Gammaproteobacteria bacterium]